MKFNVTYTLANEKFGKGIEVKNTDSPIEAKSLSDLVKQQGSCLGDTHIGLGLEIIGVSIQKVVP